MEQDKNRQAPDPQKVFAAIAAILSRREGRTVQLVAVHEKTAQDVAQAG